MQHELVASPIAPVGGRLSALSAPGLGIAVDEEVLRRYVFSGH
jgi:L-alanine-DL-glutamate epimerase-like enolase superfamily enzyme